MSYGGGHLCGTGRRGATEFPAAWSREQIVELVVDVARYPDDTPLRLPDGSWRTAGVRDGVRVVASAVDAGDADLNPVFLEVGVGARF